MITIGVQSHSWLLKKLGLHEILSQNTKQLKNQPLYFFIMMIQINKHQWSTEKWQRKYSKISYDPSQYSGVTNTRSSRHRACSHWLHALRISGSSNTDRHTLNRMLTLRDTVSQVRENLPSPDERPSLHQPLWLWRGMNWFPSIHPAHTKEGINLPSSRQASDSTINIFHKASIKSDYIFAGNFAAKC